MPSNASGTAAARPQRADARRNVAAILEAATACLARDPEVSVADIAAAAGVGRITLYGHFKTRAELVDAVFVQVVERSNAALASTDTSGDPVAALGRLVAASWQLVDQFRNIMAAAQRELPAERIRSVHDIQVLQRARDLIARGRDAGAFRTDLPEEWLITTSVALMHAAAEDVNNGRLKAEDAAGLITATLQSAFTPPAADRTLLNGCCFNRRVMAPPAVDGRGCDFRCAHRGLGCRGRYECAGDGEAGHQDRQVLAHASSSYWLRRDIRTRRLVRPTWSP